MADRVHGARAVIAARAAIAALALLACTRAELPPPGVQPAAGPARVVLGPMVGHVTEASARIWVELDRPGRLTVELTDPEGETERGAADVRGLGGGIALVDVADLDPGTSDHARLSMDGLQIAVDPPLEIRTFPRPTDPSRVRIVLVSCARVAWDSIQSSWAAVAAERADAVLWLGDNGYLEHADSIRPADYTSADRIERRYREMRGLPAVQPVLRTSANYAIWDDRDYGDSDSDRTSPSRLAVAEIFERYWANPSYGEGPGFDGIYGRFRIGAAEVFLIDDRFWRDPDSLPDSPSKTVLGTVQKEWLKRSLDESDADLKIVAIGHQVLPEYHEW